MGISMATVFAVHGGSFGPDARFGIKRGKNESADGGSANVRLRTVPRTFTDDGFISAARSNGTESQIVDKRSGRYGSTMTLDGGPEAAALASAMIANDDSAAAVKTVRAAHPNRSKRNRGSKRSAKRAAAAARTGNNGQPAVV